MPISRREILEKASYLLAGGFFATIPNIAIPARAQGSGANSLGLIGSHGLSTFGELSLPEDFRYFPYINPQAPKGGLLSIQIKNTSGNQNFETFDTLNIYSFKGDGAAGMEGTFDSLMTGYANEPDSVYGLLAEKVRWSEDRLTYWFHLRPEACFHDGTQLTAEDVVFSFKTLKEKGHPLFRLLLKEMQDVSAQDPQTVKIILTPARSRDLHLFLSTLPIFSAKWWQGRDFEASTLEAPLGSGPYKLAQFEQGRHLLFERNKDYWATNLPVNVGQNNFDQIRYTYYRDRTPAFEDFKVGRINFNEEFTSKFWALAYDFPAVQDGRVKKEELPNGTPPPIQGWYFNTRRPQLADPKIRQALNYCFDFEWTNKNIMFSSYKRLTSYFENTDMQAKGAPSPEELALLSPWRDQLPTAVFEPPWLPPVSDGSGADRTLLQQADKLLKEAGCKRENGRLLLPNGHPLILEFLDSSPALHPHTEPFQANLRKLGIECSSRVVDAAQYKRRLDAFDFDVIVSAMGSSLTPGDGLVLQFSSEAAKTNGSRNMSGVSHPAVDDLLQKITHAQTREALNIACRALDRILCSGYYWIPMWYRNKSLIAYWDVFDHPAATPKYGTGAPSTWWWDEVKARKLGMTTLQRGAS